MATALAVLSVGGCGSSGSQAEKPKATPTATSAPHKVTKADFEARGLTWPLTVPEATLHCVKRGNARIPLVTVGEQTYALGGVPSDWPMLRPEDKVWADSATIPGAKKPIMDMQEKALSLS